MRIIAYDRLGPGAVLVSEVDSAALERAGN